MTNFTFEETGSFFVLLLVVTLTLGGCSRRQSDEAAVRKEYDIPSAAKVVNYEGYPDNSGWGPREALRITISFQVDSADFAKYLNEVSDQDHWQPLPIPERFLVRMAAVETRKRWIAENYELLNEPLPPEGSVHNPTEKQILKEFVASLPAQPEKGLFQIRTAGDNIMYSEKSLYSTPNRDLNDFMLAMLDFENRRIIVRVSTNY